MEECQNTDVSSRRFRGLLQYLLRRRLYGRFLSKKSTSSGGCPLNDIYVDYIFEYDIHNQKFNGTLRNPKSQVVQRLKTIIIDWTAQEIYLRNLRNKVSNNVCIDRIVDVTQQHGGVRTVRYYVSIPIPRSLIPIVRRILTKVFQKLQEKYFCMAGENFSQKMVVVPF